MLCVEVHHPVILLLVIFTVGAAIAIIITILVVVRILVNYCRITFKLGLVLLVTAAVLAISLQLFLFLLFLLDEIVQFLITLFDDIGEDLTGLGAGLGLMAVGVTIERIKDGPRMHDGHHVVHGLARWGCAHHWA